MTAIKRCCALALAVLMILTALPVTAFAQAAEQEVNASLQETTVSGIANDIARQVLRSGQKNGEKSRWRTPRSSTTATKSRSSWW